MEHKPMTAWMQEVEQSGEIAERSVTQGSASIAVLRCTIDLSNPLFPPLFFLR
ncbi:MAG: hypothetical protein Q7U18_03070 [Methylobacter sp.]|nr:hypothetical protein [Methylobacter sp.]